MEGEPRIDAERVPMVDSRCGVPLGDPPLAVHADESLFPVHLDAEFPFIESVKLCTRKGHLVRCGRQRREVRFLGVVKARGSVTIWRHITRRPGL
jgi:hypothetical protein